MMTLTTGRGIWFLSSQQHLSLILVTVPPPFRDVTPLHFIQLERGFPSHSSFPLTRCRRMIQAKPIGLGLLAISILNTEGGWGRDPGRNVHSTVGMPKSALGAVFPRSGCSLFSFLSSLSSIYYYQFIIIFLLKLVVFCFCCLWSVYMIPRGTE